MGEEWRQSTGGKSPVFFMNATSERDFTNALHGNFAIPIPLLESYLTHRL
jgi:hypothetical protein